MSTLERLRGGLSRTWESVTEGWRELVERAGDALTRFHPAPASHEVETPEDRMAREGSRWGVVAAEVVLGDDKVGIAMEVPGMEAGDFDIDIVASEHDPHESETFRAIKIGRRYGLIKRRAIMGGTGP